MNFKGLLCAIVISTGFAQLGFAEQQAKIATDLRTAVGQVDVIVQYARTPLTLDLQGLLSLGGSLLKELKLINAVQLLLPATKLASLSDDPNVLYISPNRGINARLDFANPAVAANVAAAAGYDGSGVRVAVIDSGISREPDLNGGFLGLSRVVYDENFVKNEPLVVADRYGHGTHVAGIIAGNARQSSAGPVKFRGMGSGIELVNLRVLDKDGHGSDSSVIAAIDRAISLKDLLRIRVINLSLGRPVFESWTKDPLCQAVGRAWAAGIVVVVAAGNEGRNNTAGTSGYGTISSPGNHPQVITVGAMNDRGTVSTSDDIMATYSSKGPSAIDHVIKPDLVAPGNRIISIMPGSSTLQQTVGASGAVLWSYYLNTVRQGYSTDYLRLSGTSMAAPMVAGAAALILQKDPRVSPDTVKARLMQTARKTFPAGVVPVTDPSTGATFQIEHDIFTVGAGYMNIADALNSTLTVPAGASAASPTAARNAGRIMMVKSGPSLYGNSAVWGENIVWGSSAVWGSNAVWGNNIVWGGDDVSGSNIVWGSSAVWGESGTAGYSAVWGENIIWGGDQQSGSEAMSARLNGEQ